MDDEAVSHMLCMAVGCKAIATKQMLCKVVLEKDDKEVTETIRLCREHYLMQMAHQYANEEKANA